MWISTNIFLMPTPQEISYKISHCIAEIRPKIKDLPRKEAIRIIEEAAAVYHLNYKNLARILGFEFRIKTAIVKQAKVYKPKNNIDKPKANLIKDLFRNQNEYACFNAKLYLMKKYGGYALYEEYASTKRGERYEWIKNNKDAVLATYFVGKSKKQKLPVVLSLSKDEPKNPEQLKPIPNYPNYYIGNLGNVWSDAWGKRKLVAKRKHRDGRIYVMLWKNNQRKCFYVHRIMAECWMDKIDGLTDVFFRNGDKTDCRLENLYFAKQLPNKPTWNASTKAKGETCTWWVKLKEREVIEIYLSKKSRDELAKQYGVSRELVSMIKNDKRWKWLTKHYTHLEIAI